MFSAGGMESEYKAKLESLYSELGSTIAVGQALGFSSEKIRKDMPRSPSFQRNGSIQKIAKCSVRNATIEGIIENRVNCWKPLRALTTTT